MDNERKTFHHPDRDGRWVLFEMWGLLWGLPLHVLGGILFLLLNSTLITRKIRVEFPFIEVEIFPRGTNAWEKFWRGKFIKWAGMNLGIFSFLTPYAFERYDHVAHERRHAYQIFLFGLLFPILYYGHSVFIYFFQHDKHPYHNNAFEMDADQYAGQPEHTYSSDDSRWPW